MIIPSLFSLKDVSQDALSKIRSLPDDKEYAALIRGGQYVEVPNLSANNDTIKIDTSVLQPGDIIFHTHYDDSHNGWFSPTDLASSLLLGYPVLLYHTRFRVWDYYDPKFPHPKPLDVRTPVLVEESFLKLKYEPVRCDCYSFARDFREAIYHLPMKDIYSENQDPAYWYPKFTDVESLGFKKTKKTLSDVQPGDVLLLRISPNMPFHVAIATSKTRGIHQLSKHSEYCYLPEFSNHLIGIYDYVEPV